MDHTPGARQFANLDAWKTYYGGKSGLPWSDLERFIERRR
jgi:alpha-D-ribose 1-methylphosphonate 5-triphosphate diphosphatase